MMNHGEKIRVWVAHDDAILNAGLCALLQACTDIDVTLAGTEGVSERTADVIITGHRKGIERMNNGEASEHRPRVLIITHLEREWDVRNAMTAGVHGYLLQSCSAEQLVAAVRTLARGMRYLSAELSRCMADSVTRIGLTSRETDVLQLLAQGCCNKSIARELGIGVGTVKTHVKGLFDKLGATARTHAVVLATRRGLVGDYQREPMNQH